MGKGVSDTQVADAPLRLIEHPACRAHCVARAENKAMAEAYDWARRTFPVSERSMKAAFMLVLCGAVELSPDGTAQVWYHGQHSRTYFVDTQSCSCSAFTNTHGFCKHINARDIARYASELVRQYLSDPAQIALLHRDCPHSIAEQSTGLYYRRDVRLGVLDISDPA
jgi:predicted nucleic acid-binding Zn finger protein